MRVNGKEEKFQLDTGTMHYYHNVRYDICCPVRAQRAMQLGAKATYIALIMCKVGTVGKISIDCQPEGPGFNPRPGQGLNFGRPSFATPSTVDTGVKPLV